MKLQAAFLKPEVCYPVTNSILIKLPVCSQIGCAVSCQRAFFQVISAKESMGCTSLNLGNDGDEHTKSLNLEMHHCDALKYSLIICKRGWYSVVVMWNFLNISECSNIPVKLLFCLWILRFWKGMFYSMVAGLSRRTSASSSSNTVSASNLSIIVWYGERTHMERAGV